MDYKKFFASMRETFPSGAYFFYGDEEYGMHSILKSLKGGIEQRELNVTEYRQENATAVISSCETMPFFAPKRLIICRDWSKEDENTYLEYIESVPQSTLLIFLLSGKPHASNAFFKAMKKANRDVAFDAMDEADATRFVQKHVSASSCSMEASVVRHLIAAVGTDGYTLISEIEKLCAYAGDETIITREMLEKVVVKNIEYRIFNVLDDIMNARVKEGLGALFEMLDKNDVHPMQAASILAGQCRNLLGIKACVSANIRDEGRIAKELSMSPYVVKKSMRLSASKTAEEIERALMAFIDVDYRIKTGQAQERTAIEAAIYTMLLK